MEVSLNPSLVPGILDPFRNYKNFLGNLHKNDKGIPCKKKGGKRRENGKGIVAFNSNI